MLLDKQDVDANRLESGEVKPITWMCDFDAVK